MSGRATWRLRNFTLRDDEPAPWQNQRYCCLKSYVVARIRSSHLRLAEIICYSWRGLRSPLAGLWLIIDSLRVQFFTIGTFCAWKLRLLLTLNLIHLHRHPHTCDTFFLFHFLSAHRVYRVIQLHGVIPRDRPGLLSTCYRLIAVLTTISHESYLELS